jgi:leucyl-tRNA synthetase
MLGLDGLCSLAAWPNYDESMLIDESIVMPIQIKGKLQGRITVPTDMGEAEIIAAALAEEQIAKILDGNKPRKVIVVPGKIVNVIP